MMFLSIYLLWASVAAKGDLKVLMLGKGKTRI
jgi:hypothetical protein